MLLNLISCTNQNFYTNNGSILHVYCGRWCSSWQTHIHHPSLHFQLRLVYCFGFSGSSSTRTKPVNNWLKSSSYLYEIKICYDMWKNNKKRIRLNSIWILFWSHSTACISPPVGIYFLPPLLFNLLLIYRPIFISKKMNNLAMIVSMSLSNT